MAVHVQEPGKGEALVVLNTPETASKVLQKPVAPAGQQVVAATSEPAKPEADASASAGTPAAAATTPPSGDQSAPAGEAAQSGTATAPTDGSGAAGDAGGKVVADAGQGAGSQPAPSTEDKPATAQASASVEDKAPSTTADASKPAAEPKVTVDAVEVEDGKLFVAGSAKTKAPVRVYMDDKLVGEAKPEESGRWLLETKRAVEPGRRIVRADQVEADGSGKVVERAEVPFERTEDVAMLAPVVATGGGASGAAADGNVPAPQNVIIRRGDNLWTISRRLYGHGIRYSTIYEANHDQIRSPHLIYPGQTFVLPAGDANWTN